MKNLFLLAGIIFFLSCREEKRTAPPESIDLTEMNRDIVRRESGIIESFIRRHGMNTISTGTGLRYQIVKEGQGRKAALKDMVSISFRRYTLDGTFIDSAGVQQPFTFVVGVSEQPRGLEEGLMLMNEGTVAKLVIPSHLAYGMSGDGREIPPGTALYYEVELLDISE